MLYVVTYVSKFLTTSVQLVMNVLTCRWDVEGEEGATFCSN